jgi:hypothetical protein
MALTKLNHSSMPTGTVLQVIKNDQHDSSVETTISSTTYADVTGWSASITPKFANSMIKVEAHGAGLSRGAGVSFKLKLLRDTTSVIEMTRFMFTESSGTWGDANATFIGYDTSHNSTSSITYKIQMACHSTITNRELRLGSKQSGSDNGYVSFTLTEIKQ